MPVPVPSEIRCHTRRVRDFGGLYVALVLLSFHSALVIYINSSFLEQFFSHNTIGALYTIGSLMTIVFFLLIPPVMRSVGNFRLTLFLTAIELLTLVFLAFVETPFLAGALFLIHQAVVPILFFSMDIFMEALTGDCERETGGRRGLFLTIMSLTIALSALLSGYLIGDAVPQFALVYMTSALLLVPFFVMILRSFHTFRDGTYENHSLLDGLTQFWRTPDIRNVFFAHFTLQLFFAWMVVYTPLYLSSVMGFGWELIGQILFIGLMAYVLLEYPVGVIADRWLGEKEMMAVGFLIVAVSTSWLLFLTPQSIGLWMIAMFATRVGASLIEATSESYFFKHTNGDDSALISFFRITRPLSYVLGALLGSITLYLFNDQMQFLFMVLAFLMIPGFFFTLKLKDTK
jgi:MFS family permease